MGEAVERSLPEVGAGLQTGPGFVSSAVKFALELLCWYVPEFSPLFRPLVVPKSLSGIEWAVVGYAVLVCIYSMSARVVDLMHLNGANRGTSSA
jgi:hypothetical protein